MASLGSNKPPTNKLAFKLILFIAGFIFTLLFYWLSVPDAPEGKFMAGFGGGIFWPFFAPTRWQMIQRKFKGAD